MRIFYFIFFLFSFTNSTVAQYNMDLVWPLGYTSYPRVNLNFTSGTLVLDTCARDMKFAVSNACISDSAGHLIAYTNGCFMANANNDTMLNGDGLNPDPCTDDVCASGNIVAQGNLFLPDPGNSNKFYLFHETCDYTNNGSPRVLFSSIVDLSLDSGRGAVINKNVNVYNHRLCDGSLCAIKHANGIDWWVFVHNRLSDEWARFLLTAGGIQGPFLQSIGPVFDDDSRGNTKFSPDGNYLASSTQHGDIHLFQVDRCNGLLSNYLFIPKQDPSPIAFVEFSSTSRFLYYIGLDNIYQLDMTASNIEASSILIATYDGFANPLPTRFWLPQLAPDGKIYMAATNGTNRLHTIENPDSLGLAANVQQHNLILPCNNSGTIPSFPNYHLAALDTTLCSTDITSYRKTTYTNFVHPNPVSDHIRPVDLGFRIDEISIHTILGNEVLRIKDPPKDFEINVEMLPSGFYLILLHSGGGVITNKFVKE